LTNTLTRALKALGLGMKELNAHREQVITVVDERVKGLTLCGLLLHDLALGAVCAGLDVRKDSVVACARHTIDDNVRRGRRLDTDELRAASAAHGNSPG
jgi:hypothetical protein